MDLVDDEDPRYEPKPFEPTAEEPTMAAKIFGDGDPGHFLDLHPVETADEVERFVEWVESERARLELDANIEAGLAIRPKRRPRIAWVA